MLYFFHFRHYEFLYSPNYTDVSSMTQCFKFLFEPIVQPEIIYYQPRPRPLPMLIAEIEKQRAEHMLKQSPWKWPIRKRQFLAAESDNESSELSEFSEEPDEEEQIEPQNANEMNARMGDEEQEEKEVEIVKNLLSL